MKKLILALPLLIVSFGSIAQAMSPAIKEYVVQPVTHHLVKVQNRNKVRECYSVFVDGKPHFNPKICLDAGGKTSLRVFVETPPNQKTITKVCTEKVDSDKNSQRFQLCTSIVTYYPEQQLSSSRQ